MIYNGLNKKSQHGAAALILVLLIILTGATVMLSRMTAQNFKVERERKTADALAEAKAALIAYATTVNLVAAGCAANCRRPGDLPCPDMNNDGIQEASCGNAAGSTQQANRLGRLPWKTLGLNELRDGDNEPLWYAVSSRYKQNTRFFPLNSETAGTISVRNSSGDITNDGAGSTGAVAVIFSVGPPLTRQDGIAQSREAVNINNPSSYLDIALGEDNANFVDGTLNGFIAAPVYNAIGALISNDKALVITQDEFSNAISTRVASQVQNALLDYYCGNGNSNYTTRTCINVGGNRFYPSPARFTDGTCLGNLDAIPCVSDDAVNGGRLPSTPAVAWNATSSLLGIRNNNWFQQNGWRELVYYARAPACQAATLNCTGIGFLTLNGINVQVVTILSGNALASQPRLASKTMESNYLELGNVFPLDNNYIRMPVSAQINDYVVSIP